MKPKRSGAREEGTGDVAARPEDDESRVLTRHAVADALGRDGAFGDVLILSHEAAERIFTPKRRELLRTIERREVGSQRKLADLVDREPGAVQRDLQHLIETDLVDVARDGRALKPELKWDTVVVEPIVAPDAVGEHDADFTVENDP